MHPITYDKALLNYVIMYYITEFSFGLVKLDLVYV